MSQSFIDALMHFIALLYLPLDERTSGNLEPELEDYIKKAGIMVPPADCLKVFNAYYGKYCREYLSREHSPGQDNTFLRRQLLVDTARSAQMNLYLRERYLLILGLLEYTGFNESGTDLITDDIREIALALNIPPDDFNEGLIFINESLHEPDRTELIIEDSNEEILEGSWIDQHTPVIDLLQRHIIDNRIRGRLFIKYFEKYHLFVLKYNGQQSLMINNKKVHPEYFYSFGLHAVLAFDNEEYIHFDEIASHFRLKYNQARIRITGEDITYQYPNSGYTIKPFNFCEDAGQLIGIVGNNGVGKSAILKLIAGINPPFSGDIYINGASLTQNEFKLSSAIGYVSQENMYYDELTIYENLFYHARLCMGDLTVPELRKRTEEVIRKFDLQDVQDIKPVEFDERRVTHFDRVSLNIAFELIRDPYILCLDEPLTILPFADSKRLLNILKEETFDGKIVFLSIHLPSPEIYNMFDKVWFIDQGGHMIYQGGTMQALDYFHSSGIIPFRIVSVREDIVSPEDIISLVETKKIRPDGVIGDERMVEPEIWYDLFRTKQDSKHKNPDTGSPLPVKPSSIPGIEKQLQLYLLRLIKIRFTRLKYVLVAFLVIPSLGALIALSTRHQGSEGYLLGENKLLPLFIFLSVIFMFFTGMLNGADEIMNEKSKLKRDLNLRLSHFSYANSKVLFIALASIIQSLVFTTISHAILKLEGLFFPFFLVYTSIAVLGGLLAMILSSAFRRIYAVYILVPFFVIPNLLFSGYLIPYNHENDLRKNSPVAAELIPARWAYEALVVSCFSGNIFNRDYFDTQLTYYQHKFLKDNVLPLLFSGLDECMECYVSGESDEELDHCLRVFRNELFYISEMEEVAPFTSFNSLTNDAFNEAVYNDVFGYLTYLDFFFEVELSDLKDKTVFPDDVTPESGDLFKLKKLHHNDAVEDLVYGYDAEKQVYLYKDRVIKRGKPIYLLPEDYLGRAHFFAPYKRVGGQSVRTCHFNINALWTISAFLYFVFVTRLGVWFFNLFRKKEEIIAF